MDDQSAASTAVPVSRDRYYGHAIPDLTFSRLVPAKAARNGDKVYLHYLPDGRTYSYRDVDRLSNRWANGLLKLGITHGTHVALVMQNSPELLLLYFALGKIGAVTIPVNPAVRGDLLQYFIVQSDSQAVIADEEYLERVLEVRPNTPAVRCVIGLAAGSGLPASARAAGVLDFSAIDSGDDKAPDVAVKFSDMASLMYTSGTTGPSKGTVYSQSRMFLYPLSANAAVGYRHTDTFYVSLPIFHINGLLGSCFGMYVADGTVALARRFSASNFWPDIAKSRATLTNLLGSMGNILWNLPPSPLDASHTVRMIRWPSANFPLEFEKRFNTRLLSGFGLSDFGIATDYTITDPVDKLGSAGHLRPGWHVRIVDENDFEMPLGEIGEIALRCDVPWLAWGGYYKMPEATLATLRNGWFHTGDLGYLDADGYLWFADRKKDAIRRRGENISAWEVEQLIGKHPAISDVAAFAAKTEMNDEEVAVAVVLQEGQNLSEAELIEHCQGNMAYYMVPRFVRFVPDLPRTATHKVEKHKLRADITDNRREWWDREQAGIALRR
jgi:crotonobetaine/carnitine-CoA ligase